MKTFWTAAILVMGLAAGAVLLASAPASDSSSTSTASKEGGETPEHRKEVLSDVYFVDKKYRSMMGPYSQQEVFLGDPEKPELVWITGYSATMVDKEGQGTLPQEFMCHSNLDLDPRLHNRIFNSRKPISGRLFTLSQGQFEIDLPEGFGIPLLSNQPMTLTTQVLNLNHDQIGLDVRHKVALEYVRDEELAGPIKPLFSIAAYALASLEEHELEFGNEEMDHGASCLVRDNASSHEYSDSLGRKFTGHWVVKPGREVNRTLVTEILNLPFDTTVHYIAVHLHPFAESLELKDLTTGETVFKSKVRPAEKGVGIDHVEYFSSAEGVLLHKDHEYEMVSVYDNTSGEEQDSMAVMYMYLLDKRFEKPDLERAAKLVAETSPPVSSSEGM